MLDKLEKYFNWGSITRCTLKLVLVPFLERIDSDAVILDVGGKDSPYKKYIKSNKIKILDIVSEHKPDYCCDIHHMDIIPNESFDLVLATEILEHCYDPHLAVKEIFRVLKSGGQCILTTRFFHPIHEDPHDYFRFSKDGLDYLFKDFFKSEVIPHGNRFHIIWKCLFFPPLNYFLYFLNPLVAKINVKRTEYPLGYLVSAKK